MRWLVLGLLCFCCGDWGIGAIIILLALGDSRLGR